MNWACKLVNESLIFASADLARASPELWRRFVMAFEEHVEDTKDALVQSPVETLRGHQGHARECVHLHRVFQNCVATADKLKGRNNANY